LCPRFYSISSSSVVSPKHIAITIATSTHNSHNLPIPGLTTSYISSFESQTPPLFDLSGPNNLLASTRIFAHIQTSKFRLPTLPKTPIIMIASGSGLAPFRGFLQERARLATLGRPIGPTKLFFGCRAPDTDYLYASELNEFQSQIGPDVLEIATAFSRVDRNESGGRMYVQDRLREKDEEVIRLLCEENAYLYICGSASMARDVATVLGGCLQRRLGWEEGRLREWSEQMKRSRRWQEDVWG
jgi:NADPH-ferrihemoprotein reductase